MCNALSPTRVLSDPASAGFQNSLPVGISPMEFDNSLRIA